MTDTDLDYLDAELQRRADSLWCAVTGDADLFAHLRTVLSELRAEARRLPGVNSSSVKPEYESLTLPAVVSRRQEPEPKSIN